MWSDCVANQEEVFQFVAVALESSLYSPVQRHYTLGLLFWEAVVRSNGKENRNEKNQWRYNVELVITMEKMWGDPQTCLSEGWREKMASVQ